MRMIQAKEDPIELFEDWLSEAEKADIEIPNAMSLATMGLDGIPSVRMVLLKNRGENGFVFYTNKNSRKGKEIAQNQYAALCFHWEKLRRQVRVRGVTEQVDDEEADAYFATRDRQSQIGAWASDQSQPLKGRLDLEKNFARYANQFGLGKVHRPEFWIGYRLLPISIEFWQQMPFRLHDRLIYEREGERWKKTYLYP